VDLILTSGLATVETLDTNSETRSSNHSGSQNLLKSQCDDDISQNSDAEIQDDIEIKDDIDIQDDIEIKDDIDIQDNIEIKDDIDIQDEIEIKDEIDILDDIEIKDDIEICRLCTEQFASKSDLIQHLYDTHV